MQLGSVTTAACGATSCGSAREACALVVLPGPAEERAVYSVWIWEMGPEFREERAQRGTRSGLGV